MMFLTLPLDLYNHYWSTTHTCVEQFSHHHAYAPCPPVFTSLAELYTLHFCFRDLIHNIYIYSCNCRCLLTASKQFFRDRPFNLKGRGGLWFFVSFRIFFPDNASQNNYFFCRAKSTFFFQNLTLGYLTKTLNQIFFFSSTKIRIFFSATLGIRIFFQKKTINPPFKLNGRSLTATQFTITVYNIQPALDLIFYSCLSPHLSSIFHCSYLFFKSITCIFKIVKMYMGLISIQKY